MANEDLSKLELETKIQKLQIETQLLQQQQQRERHWIEKVKGLSGMTGIVTALVAVVTVGWSISGGLQQQALSRDARYEERLESAFAKLGSENARDRITGTASLQVMLEQGDQSRQRQILILLGKVVSIEEDQEIREAILDIFLGLDGATIDPAVLADATKAMVRTNRTLTSLYEARIFDRFFDTKELAPSDPLTRLAATGAVIAALARTQQVAKDLSGIYCPKCNFSGADLAGINLQDAWLNDAKFDKANLKGASLKGAGLGGTTFIQTNLTRATFGETETSWFGNYNFANVARGLYPRQPDFTCANLEDANFSGYYLFGVWQGTDYGEEAIVPWFTGAKLTQTRLSGMGFYLITNQNVLANPSHAAATTRDFPFAVEPNYRTFTLSTGQPIFAQTIANDVALRQTPALTPKVLQSFADRFSKANWQQADLPRGLRELLAQMPPAKKNYDCTGERKFPD
jgi:uncharacterized protein YjbI with pentapeptide repeats